MYAIRSYYGKINPEESGELFIRHALIQGEIFQEFGFMAHNRNLIEEIATLEDVITSYSIHYTKLYDLYRKVNISINAGIRARPQTVGRNNFV